MRGSIVVMDNRDMEETWLHINRGESGIVEVSRAEAMKLLEGFYVNAAHGSTGRVDKEKMEVNGHDLQIALQELYEWVHRVILDCDFYVDVGVVVRQGHIEEEREKDFKDAFPEYTRELKRG